MLYEGIQVCQIHVNSSSQFKFSKGKQIIQGENSHNDSQLCIMNVKRMRDNRMVVRMYDMKRYPVVINKKMLSVSSDRNVEPTRFFLFEDGDKYKLMYQDEYLRIIGGSGKQQLRLFKPEKCSVYCSLKIVNDVTQFVIKNKSNVDTYIKKHNITLKCNSTLAYMYLIVLAETLQELDKEFGLAFMNNLENVSFGGDSLCNYMSKHDVVKGFLKKHINEHRNKFCREYKRLISRNVYTGLAGILIPLMELGLLSKELTQNSLCDEKNVNTDDLAKVLEQIFMNICTNDFKGESDTCESVECRLSVVGTKCCTFENGCAIKVMKTLLESPLDTTPLSSKLTGVKQIRDRELELENMIQGSELTLAPPNTMPLKSTQSGNIREYSTKIKQSNKKAKKICQNPRFPHYRNIAGGVCFTDERKDQGITEKGNPINSWCYSDLKKHYGDDKVCNACKNHEYPVGPYKAIDDKYYCFKSGVTPKPKKNKRTDWCSIDTNGKQPC